VRGVPLKVIYVHVAKSLYFLYAADGIKTLKDLERKRIAIDAVGGSQDIAVRQAMQDAGADHSKSTFIAMGFQNTPPSMIAGAVDAGVLTPPSEFQLKNSARKFINLGFLGDLTPGLTGGIATADRVIRERPEMLRAVLRAHTKAHRFVLENREQTVAIMSKFLNLSMEDAAESYDSTVRPHYNATGIIPADTQRAFIEERVRALKLKKAPENARIFDLSFVPN
jgi:ABC-type nitrate/sulfonate/bicarbonate transport system substrate-binding protein